MRLFLQCNRLTEERDEAERQLKHIKRGESSGDAGARLVLRNTAMSAFAPQEPEFGHFLFVPLQPRVDVPNLELNMPAASR